MDKKEHYATGKTHQEFVKAGKPGWYDAKRDAYFFDGETPQPLPASAKTATPTPTPTPTAAVAEAPKQNEKNDVKPTEKVKK